MAPGARARARRAMEILEEVPLASSREVCARSLSCALTCCWCAHSELSNEQSEEVPLESSHPGLAPGPTGHACVHNSSLLHSLLTAAFVGSRSQHERHSTLAAAAVGRVY